MLLGAPDLTTSNKKLLGTSASLLVTSATHLGSRFCSLRSALAGVEAEVAKAENQVHLEGRREESYEELKENK